MPEGERRLAAIMFTDMVGYTALGQKNESISLALVEEQRKLLRSILNRHNGREVKTMGDAFLVEFPSALDSVRCAYDIQRATREHNFALPGEQRVHLRIGVHLGDVVESHGDISGDAVNVASRIESLAEDGGVCLTRQVYDHVQNKFELPLTSLGNKLLKNVSVPVEVYKIALPWETRTASESTGLDKYRVAVIPFENISAEREDEYFADGLTEELISTLSKVKELRVISRTSVMQYKNKSKPIRDVGRDLDAGTLLEGSVRRAGNRVRITIQMIDANQDEHLWAEKYDRELDDIFTIQTDIAKRVADALSVKLLSSEKKDIEKESTGNTEAYTLYLKGRYYWNERTNESMDKAVKYFEEAVKLDPSFALAYAGLSDCYTISATYGWLMPTECHPKAKAYALKAIEMDPRLAEPHASLGMVYAHYEHRWHEAEEEFKRTLELKPSYATAYHWHSFILRHMGRFEESYEQIKRAGELDPLSRIIGVDVAQVLLILGKFKEAIEQCKRVIEVNPDYAYVHLYLGWAYYLDSRLDEAKDEMRNAVTLSGDDPLFKADLACLLGFTGRRDEANKIIKELEDLAKTTYVDKVFIAQALFGAGRVDEAFGYVEKGYQERTDLILQLRWWPWFKVLRKDPRWASFNKRLGLPEN